MHMPSPSARSSSSTSSSCPSARRTSRAVTRSFTWFCGLRNQRLDGEVVDRAGHAAGLLVDEGDRVVGEQGVGEQGVGAAGEGEVVAQVAAGLLEGHAVELVAQRDALAERGGAAEPQA